MTADQRRRLENLSAAVAPCLGCVEQDLVDAESLFPDRGSQLRDLVDQMRQAQGLPSNRPSEEELEAATSRGSSVEGPLNERP